MMHALLAIKSSVQHPVYLSEFAREFKREEDRKKRFEVEIIKKIENIINSIIKSHNIHNTIERHLPEIFRLRIKLSKWLITNNIDLISGAENTLTELNKIYETLNKKEEIILVENTIFALRTAARITHTILSQYSSHMDFTAKIETLEVDITYQQLKSAILLEPLPDIIKQSLFRLIDSSLSLDLALTIVYLFIFENRKLPNAKITELSKLLRDWTQEYGALAMQLMLWQPDIENVAVRL